MFFTILFMFFIAGVSLIFVDEWVPIVAKFFRIPFVKLMVPLTAFSILAIVYKSWIIGGLSIFWSGYVVFMAFCVAHTPAFYMHFLVYQALIITVCALLPTLFAYLTAKPFRRFNPPYWGSILIWVGLSTLIALLEGSI